MAASPAMDARDYLAATSGIPNEEWTVVVGGLPTSPNGVIALFDTPGQRPNPRWKLDYPTFQALIRGPKEDYVAAYAKGAQVKDALLGLEAFDTPSGSGRWDGVTMLSDLAYLRHDDERRPIFSANFRVIFEPAVTALDHREPLPL